MLNLEIDTSENEKALRSLMIELQNISEKNKKILQNNQYKKMLRAIPIHDLQQSTATWTDYDDLIQEQGTYQADVIQSRKLISKLDALGQKCPTCEQHISYNVKNSMIDEAAEKANAAEEKVNDLKRRIKSIKSENAEFTNTKNRITEWEDLYRNIDQNLQGDILDKHELETRIQVLQRDIQSAKDELARTATENERRTKRNTRIQIIQEQTDAFQREKIEYENTLAKQQRIETNLEILKKSFSTNGLIAYKIESLVKELEELVNKYLGELSDGRFTLHFVVSNDKLNVEITDNGNVVDISALSSGELARVNTATLIAIRKLMSSISKSKINILFLDEVINVLDDTGREKIVEVLLQEDELNTYIVSHGWTHPLLEKIEVVRKGNVSGLEW
jgi:DNA repair exonuclease SbcCD ATPase subunit